MLCYHQLHVVTAFHSSPPSLLFSRLNTPTSLSHSSPIMCPRPFPSSRTSFLRQKAQNSTQNLRFQNQSTPQKFLNHSVHREASSHPGVPIPEAAPVQVSIPAVHCFARYLPHLAYDHTKFLMTTHLGSEENKSAQVQIAKSPV